MTELILNDNNISEVSALSNLTDLIYLHLDDNGISDITPIIENEDFVSIFLHIENNPLNYRLRRPSPIGPHDCGRRTHELFRHNPDAVFAVHHLARIGVLGHGFVSPYTHPKPASGLYSS
jgi:Leucine-rich repeat (LRR) protein